MAFLDRNARRPSPIEPGFLLLALACFLPSAQSLRAAEPTTIRISHAEGEVLGLDGEAIEGATVRFFPSRGDSPEYPPSVRVIEPGPDPIPAPGATDPTSFSAVSGSEGLFELVDLPTGVYDIEARAPGRQTLRIPAVPIPWAGSSTVDGHDRAGRLDLGTLVLAPLATLRGRLVDPSGQPVADASVCLGASVEEADECTRSDARGRFELPIDSTWDRARLVVEHERFVPLIERIPPRSPIEPLRSILQPASRVEGWVVDAMGNSVANARITLLEGEMAEIPDPDDRKNRNAIASPVVRADDGGRFEFRARPGRLRLVASAPGYGSSEPRVLAPESTFHATGALALVLRAEASIEGHLIDADGAPIEGARVWARTPAAAGASPGNRGPRVDASTDARGRFRLEGLAPGPVLLAAVVAGLPSVTQEYTIEAGNNEIPISMPRARVLRGRVRAEDGHGIAEAELAIRSLEPGIGNSLRATSDSEGNFRFGPVGAGRYELRAEAEGMAPGPKTILELGNGPLPRPELVLERGTMVEGRISGVPADALAGLYLDASATTPPGAPRPPIVVGRVHADGRFAIGPLASGHWTLCARLDGGSRQSRIEVRVEGNSPITRDLHFDPGLELHGTVVRSGLPVPGARLLLLAETPTLTSSGLTAISDRQGRFALRGIVPGRYVLEALDAIGGRNSRSLDLHHSLELSIGLDGHNARQAVSLPEPADEGSGGVTGPR